MTDIDNRLAGKRVLLVEDDYLLVHYMTRAFEESGAEVIGTAGTVADALALLGRSETLDGAVLDINLRGEMCFDVADVLAARGVPFVFASGYGTKVLPARFRHVTLCSKPVEPSDLAAALGDIAKNQAEP